MLVQSKVTRALVLVSFLLALTTLVASPAIAGTVYVVLASDQTVDGLPLSTELVVSNPADEAITVLIHFIASGSNGADRPEGFQPQEMQVAAGQTAIFTGLTDNGGRGILEVTAPSLAAITARLVSTNGNGETHSTDVPVVGSETLLRGGRFFVLNGLERDATKRSSLVLTNLAQTANNCLIQSWTAGGSALIGVTSVAVSPLSSLTFPDAIQASGASQGEDVRIQILCGKDAYATSFVRDITTGELMTLRPAADGSSSLRAPGSRVVCEPSQFCFEKPGIFLQPTPSNAFVFYDLFPPLPTYGSIQVQLTVTHAGWSSIDNQGFHGLFWLFRNLRWNNTFAYVNIRGPNRNLLINSPQLSGANRTTAPALVQPGQTFVVDYLYDARNRTTQTTLRELDGSIIATMTDGTTLNRVDIENGFRIEFGLERGPVEVPTYGWTYSDLLVIFSP